MGDNDDITDTDLLSRIRSALDGGLATVKDKTQIPEENPVNAEAVQQHKYIDIDDYCKLVQESGLIDDSSTCADMDSRSLLSSDQIKLDSQQTPYSIEDFHSRVATFDIMKWSQKPDIISSFQCARFGWQLTEWSSLACVTCKRILPVPSQTMKFEGTGWATRLRKSMEKMGHLSTCPWTKMPSPSDILSIPTGPDLYSHILDAFASFKRMKTSPSLQDHYRLIMAKLNLKWMRELLGLELPQNDDVVGEESDKNSAANVHQDMSLFLILNGWTMVGTNDHDNDVMRCTLCLRKVPLWLCTSTPVENEVFDLLSPPPSPVKNRVITKELDPASNHWEWCPWRKALQQDFSPVARIASFLDDNAETNLVTPSNPEKIILKKTVDIYDYEKLLDDIREECTTIKLDFDKEKSGVHLIDSVSSMMTKFVASPHTPTSLSNRNHYESTTSPTTEFFLHSDNNGNKKRCNVELDDLESDTSKKRICIRDIFPITLDDNIN